MIRGIMIKKSTMLFIALYIGHSDGMEYYSGTDNEQKDVIDTVPARVLSLKEAAEFLRKSKQQSSMKTKSSDAAQLNSFSKQVKINPDDITQFICDYHAKMLESEEADDTIHGYKDDLLTLVKEESKKEHSQLLHNIKHAALLESLHKDSHDVVGQTHNQTPVTVGTHDELHDMVQHHKPNHLEQMTIKLFHMLYTQQKEAATQQKQIADEQKQHASNNFWMGVSGTFIGMLSNILQGIAYVTTVVTLAVQKSPSSPIINMTSTT